jgi:hypothetical protein
VHSGTVAVIGGPDVFGMFMDRYHAFWLSQAPHVRLPAASLLPRCARTFTAGDSRRAQPESRRSEILDAAHEVSVTPWRRPARQFRLTNHLYVAVSGFDAPRRPAISGDDEQRTDDRQAFQRVPSGLGIFGRRLIPEIVEVIDCRGDEENQKNGKEPHAEIEGNHQSGDDLESSNSNGKHLRRGHSRHRFQLRGIGDKEGGNGDPGGNKISGGLNAKQLGRPRIDKSTANKTRPKVMNAGMVGLAGCCECGVASGEQSDYERSASGFQTFKSILIG